MREDTYGLDDSQEPEETLEPSERVTCLTTHLSLEMRNSEAAASLSFSLSHTDCTDNVQSKALQMKGRKHSGCPQGVSNV